jgi:serpin B
MISAIESVKNFLPMKSLLSFLTFLFPIIIYANNPQGVVEGNNRFAFKLFHQVQGGTTGNQFFSPFSISTALAMVYAGARNETALQMNQTLNFPVNNKFHSDYKHLLNRLHDGTEGKIKLNIANGLWAQKDFKFLESYFDIVKSNYNSELKNVDFKNYIEQEKTRNDINTWVEKNTNNKIKNILSQGDLSSMTRLVLVNAIYFYGDWSTPFKKESTKPKEFSLLDGNQKMTPFMNQQGRYNYYEDSKIQAIEVPYRDNKASMVIFLPNTKEGIGDIAKSLDDKYYQDIIGSLQSTDVRMSLPKFKMDLQLELSRTLSQMGMPLAFSQDGADFSGMTGSLDLYISKVIHQAFINVDEVGTEAAAATVVTMSLMMAPQHVEPKYFNADHPFVFLIKDNTTGSILFMGKIMNPEVGK